MHVRTPVGTRPVRIVAFGAALVVALLAAPAAHAGPLVDSVTSCDNRVVEKPFTRWADFANYVLAPNGVVENRTDWSLADGATVAAGNETFYVHDPKDRASLALPAGSSATTRAMCVGIDYPTLRLIARNDGSPASWILVEVLFEDWGGNVRSLPMGAVTGGPSWQPSSPLPVIANLLPVLPNMRAPVAFRFSAFGPGDWRIDEVYVDPWRHG